MQDDGTLDLAGLNETINNLSGAGIVTNSAVGNSVLSVGSANAAVAFNGVLENGSGTVGLTKLGSSNLTVTTTNTPTGPLTIVGNGYVYLNNASGQAWAGPITFTNNTGSTPRLVLQASEQIGDTSVISFGGNGVERRFQLNGFNETIGGLNDLPGVSGNRIVEAANDNVANSPATLTLNVGAGITNSTGAYVRDASGGANSILTLIKTGAGTQTFSGSAGLVNISGPTTVSNGVLQLSGGSVLANSAVTLAGGTLNISGGGTRASVITGNGTLQVGGSTFITTATNTYTGNTLISAGTFQVGDGTINGSILTDVTNNGTFIIKVATNTLQTYTGVISGTGSFTKDIFGTLYLNSANTFAGNVTVNGGSLWINNNQSLGLGTKTVLLVNGTAGHPELHLNGTNGDIILPSAIAFTTSWSGTPVIQNDAGNNVLNGIVNLSSGGGDTYLAVNGGTLTLAGGISPSQSNRNLLLGGVGNGTVSGVISNGTQVLNSLRKVDTGTWTISGASTHSGPTKVEVGTLLVNGSLGTNTVTVSNNATLGGSGLILGAVTVLDGGFLTPGTASLGTLTVSNTLTLSANSTNLFRLNATTATNDAVVGLTTVNYGGVLVVTNINGALAAGQSYKLFSANVYNTAFASTNLPLLPVPLVWSNTLAANGTLYIISTNAFTPSQTTYLTSLVVSNAANAVVGLNPVFNTNILSGEIYAATNSLATLPLTVTVTNVAVTATNTLTVNGLFPQLLTNGIASSPLTSLAVGSNNVTVQTVSQDLSVTNLYKVNVTVLNTNAYLASLVVSNTLNAGLAFYPAGFTTPNFGPYLATNTYGSAVNVTAVGVDANATLSLSTNGVLAAALASGVTSGAQALNQPPQPPLNALVVQVVSQDQTVTNFYTVNLTVQPSLAAFTLTNRVSGGTNLALSWPADHTGYRLLMQTNNLNKGVSKSASDWGATVTDYTVTNAAAIPILKGTTNEYYRLVYP